MVLYHPENGEIVKLTQAASFKKKEQNISTELGIDENF